MTQSLYNLHEEIKRRQKVLEAAQVAYDNAYYQVTYNTL